MRIDAREKRLKKFYGLVAEEQNKTICRFLAPNSRIIDVGCGYGHLVEYLRKRGYMAIGIDGDEEVIRKAEELYPGSDFAMKDVLTWIGDKQDVDYAILRESAHHMDLTEAVSKLSQVIRKGIIIFDPNPNVIVKMSRKIIRHKDEELSLEKTLKILSSHGFTIRYTGFRDVLAFPLSGGFVGLDFVPDVDILKRLLITADSLANWILEGEHYRFFN